MGSDLEKAEAGGGGGWWQEEGGRRRVKSKSKQFVN